MEENKQAPQPNRIPEPIIAPDVPLKFPTEQSYVQQKDSHLGVVIVILVTILLMLLGGLYVWSTYLTPKEPTIITPTVTRPTPEENNEPESTKAEAVVETLEVTSTSDNLSLIEADLMSTDIESIEADLVAIEAELGIVGQ